MLLVGSSPAASDPQPGDGVRLSVSVDRTELRSTSQRPLDYTIVADSAQAARFSLRVITPEVHSRIAGLTHKEGGSLRAQTEMVFDATSGSSIRPTSMLTKDAGCAPTLLPHGGSAGDRTLEVALAAGGQATVSMAFRAPERPLWPGVDYRVEARAEPIPEGYGLTEPVITRASQIRMRGPHGTRISLSSEPQGGVLPVSPPGVVPLRQPVLLRGRTHPPLRRRLLTVRVANAAHPEYRKVGSARTDRRGRFRYNRWTPRRTGSHLVTVTSPAVRPRTLADYVCPLIFDARRR